MAQFFGWEAGFDTQLILSKMAKIRNVKEGRVSYDAFERAFWMPVLNTAIRAEKSVGSLKARCISAATGDAILNLNDAKAFLDRCDKAFSAIQKKEKSRFVVYSTVTYAGPKPLDWIADGNSRIYWQPSSKGKFLRKAIVARDGLADLRRARGVPVDSEKLTIILTHVSAYDSEHAYEIANDAFDRLRGMLNLFVNSSRMINPFAGMSTPHAVNRFRRGPYQTVHKPNGELAAEMIWYEPRWVHSLESAKFKNEATEIRKQIKGWWTKLQENSLRDHISEALLRYCRALDTHDSDSALLGMWGVLEKIAGTDKYDVIVSRVERLFKDHREARQIANHIRLRRNQTVHAAHNMGPSETDAILHQAETIAGQAIFFCLKNGKEFADKDELFDFLDMPMDQAKLRRRQKLSDFFLKYQNR